MLRRFVKSVTAGHGLSTESTIKSLTEEVSMQQDSRTLPSPPTVLPTALASYVAASTLCIWYKFDRSLALATLYPSR